MLGNFFQKGSPEGEGHPEDAQAAAPQGGQPQKRRPTPAAQAPSAEALEQQFAQWVMMQAQNIMMALGQMPNGMSAEPNLEAAKMLLDQLEMVGHKTAGNLSSRERRILNRFKDELSIAFTEISGGTPPSLMPSRSAMIDLDQLAGPPMEMDGEDEEPTPSQRPQASEPRRSAPSASSETPEPEENKKKYFKSYG